MKTQEKFEKYKKTKEDQHPDVNVAGEPGAHTWVGRLRHVLSVRSRLQSHVVATTCTRPLKFKCKLTTVKHKTFSGSPAWGLATHMAVSYCGHTGKDTRGGHIQGGAGTQGQGQGLELRVQAPSWPCAGPSPAPGSRAHSGESRYVWPGPSHRQGKLVT